ncbi:MAG: glycosyltransferase [Burkholderiales bacterium]|nr:glycosyltransferase [Bacteroidia bacterium]
MKVSIITITYNSESTLIDTIDSVLNQTYRDIEYIIVDGASTDDTISIVHSYKEKITKFISEKDNGLYDALNKGIAMASGDVIGILHSDDFYTSHHIIENVVNTFQANHSDAVYADLYYVDKDDTNKIFRKWKSGHYKHGMFLNGWMPPHPTFFVKKSSYEKYGCFNLDLVSAADYELMLRFIHKHQIKLAYLPEFIIKMRVGGKSNVSLKNRIRANKEDKKAWKMNGLNPYFYTMYLKPLRKIIQLFKK